MIRVIVAGSTGRVGRVMMSGLANYPDVSVVGGFGHADAAPNWSAWRRTQTSWSTSPRDLPRPICCVAAADLGLHVVSGTSGLIRRARQVDAALA